MKRLSVISIIILLMIFMPSVLFAENFGKIKDIELNLLGFNEAKELSVPLYENGICIAPASFEDIYRLYGHYRQNEQPVFISSDLIFHTVHRIFAHSLQIIELGQVDNLRQFSKAMYEAALEMEKTYESDDELLKACDLLAAYFAVPNLLLGNNIHMSSDLEKKVMEEIRLINTHKGFSFSRIFNHKEDFSQYAVRGHYTRSKELEQYFLASMWYGRRMFRFDETRPEGAGDPLDNPGLKGWWDKKADALPDIASIEIRAAALLIHIIENTSVMGKPGAEVYKKLKNPLDLFVGKSEDITISALSKTIKQIFNKNWKPDDLKDMEKLCKLGRKAAQANNPRIDSTGMGRKGLTLLGQRFTADAAIFQKLVHERENNPMPYKGKSPDNNKPFTWVMDQASGPVRGFPRGMDIMSISGSKMAEKMLAQLGDADYKGYRKNAARLRKQMEKFKPSENLYEQMLFSFMPLFKLPSGVPKFMKTDEWQKKSLNTALGAWTELRHDTVLYAKQSYTSVPRGLMPQQIQLAYLEPAPEAYKRLAQAVNTLADSDINLPEYLSQTCDNMHSILKRLVKISKKELKGKYPDNKDTGFLTGLPETLKEILQIPEQVMKKIANDTGNQMALAVDVHTRMPIALTQALGFPGKIIAVIPVNEKPELFFGGVYSYYEFKVPYENRLTDEQWIKMLKSGNMDYKPLLY